MNRFRAIYDFLDQVGRWAQPRTTQERRAADVTTIILMAIAALLFILSLRS